MIDERRSIRLRCVEAAAKLEGTSVYDSEPVIRMADHLFQYVTEEGIYRDAAPITKPSDLDDEIPF